jgi:hypothetical protein
MVIDARTWSAREGKGDRFLMMCFDDGVLLLECEGKPEPYCNHIVPVVS